MLQGCSSSAMLNMHPPAPSGAPTGGVPSEGPLTWGGGLPPRPRWAAGVPRRLCQEAGGGGERGPPPLPPHLRGSGSNEHPRAANRESRGWGRGAAGAPPQLRQE
eukprot:9930952-Alexandrium_andersonii.AAC.1